MIRHYFMVGLLGRVYDRFQEYQPPHSLPERLAMVAQIEGVRSSTQANWRI
jgi:hypothetical protein